MAVYQAFVNPGDTIMGMELSQGGHLTHGSPVNFSGRLYNFVPYTVDRENESIDMAEVRRLLSFLPSNNADDPPFVQQWHGEDRPDTGALREVAIDVRIGNSCNCRGRR